MKKSFAFMAMLLTLCSAYSQSSLLYEIRDGKESKSSYLFGTLHMQKGSLFNWNERVLDAIDACDVAAFELNLKLNFDIRNSISPKVMKEWEDFFKEDLLPSLEAEIPADSLSARIIRFYNPVMEMAMTNMNDSTSREDFVDAYLQNYARKKQKEIMGIETFEEQLNVIASLDKQYLKDVIITFAKSENWAEGVVGMMREQNEMIKFYEEKDLDGLCELINGYVNSENQKELRDFYFQMFDARNQIMFDRTVSKFKDQSVFVAVGAGHLCGENGLVEKYKAAGYTVTPVDIISATPEVKMSWRKSKNEFYSVDLPLDVDSAFYISNDLDLGIGVSGTLVNTTFTNKGKARFTIESDVLLSEKEPFNVLDYDQNFEEIFETRDREDFQKEVLEAQRRKKELEAELMEEMNAQDLEDDDDIQSQDYMKQVMEGLKISISPLLKLSMMSGNRESRGDTILVDSPKGLLTLIYKKSFMGNTLTSIFLSDEDDDGHRQTWTLTVSGDPEILKSTDIHRFFTSFELNN
jgi:uncharacterized protein